MAIRAVDLAMPVQRTTEITQNQRGEQRPDVQHQQFAARLNKEQEQREKQVQETPKGEEAKIQKDGRGSGGGQGGNKKNDKKNRQDRQEPKVARTSDSMFDISL